MGKFIIATFILLLFLISCSNCPDSNDFKRHLNAVEIMNSTFLKNLNLLNNTNTINEISNNFPATPFLELKKKLHLIRVDKYYLNNDSTKIGIAYVFEENWKSTQYILYTLSPEDKEKFINYEQFVEYRRDIAEFNAFCTYICIDNTIAD